jgi:hypothetical protein
VIGGDAHDLRGIGKVVELVKQRFEFLHRRNPEQRARRLVGFVEIPMWDATRKPHEIAGLGLHPDPVEFQIEHAFLHQDELVLRRMHVDRHELSGVAVGFEGESRIGHRLWEIDLAENVPGLAAISRAVWGDAFLQYRHDVLLRLIKPWSIGRSNSDVHPINEFRGADIAATASRNGAAGADAKVTN